MTHDRWIQTKNGIIYESCPQDGCKGKWCSGRIVARITTLPTILFYCEDCNIRIYGGRGLPHRLEDLVLDIAQSHIDTLT